MFEDAAKEQVPNFRPSKAELCCFRCVYCWPTKGAWACVKHRINFGDINRQGAYKHMILYVCDDFERGKKVE